MKRTALIAVVLCALMLGTLGAGVVAAKQDVQAPTPADTKHFDVTLDGKVVGKLIVNTKQLTYTFNGHGLDARATYYLSCSAFLHGVDSAIASDAGTVRMEGSCEQWLGVLAEKPTFTVSTTPPPVGAIERNAVLTAEWWHTPFQFFNVYGSLKDGENGLGLVGAVVHVYLWKDGKYVEKWTKTTRNDGSFSCSQAFSGNHDAYDHPPKIVFDGMYSTWPAGVGTYWRPVPETFATYNDDWLG